MATHSSILAWEIPWTEESGRLQSMRSQRVRQDLVTEIQNKTKKLRVRYQLTDKEECTARTKKQQRQKQGTEESVRRDVDEREPALSCIMETPECLVSEKALNVMSSKNQG